MKPSQRVVTELPLRELWDDDSILAATWSRDLSPTALRALIRQGSVRFVVADMGAKPRWVSEADCFDFWKGEVQPHLAEPNQGVHLEQFPGNYCFFAAEWADGDRSPIVVLQRCH
jgi:hypothetical protein